MCRTAIPAGKSCLTRGVVVLLTLVISLSCCIASRADEPSSVDADIAILARLQRAFETLTRRVEPSVVAIRIDRRPTTASDRADWSDMSWGATGSGVIIRQDGMILTSQHVIENAMAVHVTLHDGRRIRARRIAADPRSDLAVIQISVSGLQHANLGDARGLRRGHIVLALGNPLGLSNDGHTAVTQGLVSAIGRPLPEMLGRESDRYYGDMIEVSAPINPGNSGGPLVDIRGDVVGIVTAVSSRNNGLNGLGFAVPINSYTRAIIRRLLAGQGVQYGYLGVLAANLTNEQSRAAGLPPNLGALLDAVLPNGPACNAGLQDGDIVTTVDGTQVRTADHLIRLVGAGSPKRTLKLEYVRGKEQGSVAVTLSNRPSNPAHELPRQGWTFRGATLGRLGVVMREATNLPANSLLVLLVAGDSPADDAGLTPGDIIVKIDGRPLNDTPDALLATRKGDVLVGLANGGSILVKAE